MRVYVAPTVHALAEQTGRLLQALHVRTVSLIQQSSSSFSCQE